MKKNLMMLAVLALVAGSCAPKAAEVAGPSWMEEFDGDTLDTAVWSKIPRGGAQWCWHMSDLDELYQVGDGRIALRAIANPGVPGDTASLLTGGIATKGKKSFGYGRLEICVKLEGTGGGWPAIWMMPAETEDVSGDPFWEDYPSYKNYGEIDICERLNFDPFAYQTIHTSFNLQNDGDPYQEKSATGAIDPEGYNVFAVEHYRDSIKYFINDVNTLTYRKMTEAPDGTPVPVKAQWTFDREFYLMIDMQVGASWPGPAVLEDLPAAMTVDWVRFYEFEDEGKPQE